MEKSAKGYFIFMSTLDQLFQDIDQEAQEEELQRCINFAHKQKYNFSRFKKLIDVNLKLHLLEEEARWSEEDYIIEYYAFVTEMYRQRYEFNTQQYFFRKYEVPFDSFIRVNDDLTVGTKLYINVNNR